jgi:hypothetical protein
MSEDRMQNEIKHPAPLLDENGELEKKGWARHLILDYKREDIKAGWHRIKEWDYYAVLNPEYGVTITFSDLGYIGLIAFCWLDFAEKDYHQEDKLLLFPRGNLGLPESSQEGDIKFNKKGIDLSILRKETTRDISINYPEFNDNKGMDIELSLSQDPQMDTMVIATPFEKEHHFYYNQKINCMSAKGKVTIGNSSYEFSEDDSFGVLDWGRGVWTYENTWYWGSASGKLENGKKIGFNIGYGFGDTSAATENVIFYEGKAHKFDEVEFNFNENDYLKPWTFTSNDGRFSMDFEPIVNRSSSFNLLVLKSIQNQVFGIFSGKMILDDGREIKINNLLGFAEKVYNKW